MVTIFIGVPEFINKVSTALIWICQPSHTNRAFHILGEVGKSEKVAIQGLSTLHEYYFRFTMLKKFIRNVMPIP